MVIFCVFCLLDDNGKTFNGWIMSGGFCYFFGMSLDLSRQSLYKFIPSVGLSS